VLVLMLVVVLLWAGAGACGVGVGVCVSGCSAMGCLLLLLSACPLRILDHLS
jgi:hypothetical protein